MPTSGDEPCERGEAVLGGGSDDVEPDRAGLYAGAAGADVEQTPRISEVLTQDRVLQGAQRGPALWPVP